MSEKLSDIVKEKYTNLIRQKMASSEIKSGCCPAENSAAEQVTSQLYKECDMDGMPKNFVALSLGCGNPIALGALYAGEIVLDLGNGIILSDEEADLVKGALVSAFIRAKKSAKKLREGLDYSIRQADKCDYAMIEELLRANDLPLVGVKKHLAEFIVAEQGTIVGVMGSLRKSEKGLIRSFAVAPSVRKAGIGRVLVQSMTERLKLQGVEELYLLTETAKDYFENLGFIDITRDEIPLTLLQESGLDQACPCTSYCLKRSI